MNEGEIDGKTYHAPHCDELVLHAPQDNCRYCNSYPERQAARVRDGVNFTGHNDSGKKQCPAEARRPFAKINRWAGNIACTPAVAKARDQFFEDLRNELGLCPKCGSGKTSFKGMSLICSDCGVVGGL